jgi:hypothetical protein
MLGTLKMVPIRGLHLTRQFSLVYSLGPEPAGLPGLFLNYLREERFRTQQEKTARRGTRRTKESATP